MNTSLPSDFEELRERVWEEKHDTITFFIDSISDETTLIDLHRLKGEVLAYDEILQLLRSIIKYGGSD